MCLIFIAWWTVYKNEKLIWKEQAIINLRELNYVIVSNAYFLFLQFDIIASILRCKYISVMNDTDFFYQWQIVMKNHKKFTIINHCELEIISVIFMSYQKFFLYAQCMMNMIFQSHKFFVLLHWWHYYFFENLTESSSASKHDV